ncbi:SGNH/GDSL hydrolase family protein, partial [Klebsiella sp. NPDC088457]
MAELPTPTQKTVPSDDIRDHVYAGGMLDKVVTSTDLTYTDRLGGEHYTVDGIKAEADAVVKEAQDSITILGLPFTTLAEAQVAADEGKIPEGAVTWVRNAGDASLADEYINNGGTLEATGRKMPSYELIEPLIN